MKHIPTITVSVIPHTQQRYDTCGDYEEIDEGVWDFTISESKAVYEFAILIHELIEWFFTQKRGITEKQICKFDMMFEAERKAGSWKDEEPGDDHRAPYRKEHKFATSIEKQVLDYAKENWSKYENTINSLEYKLRKKK